MPATTADLHTAFDRIEAFLAVQDGARGARLAGAVECLQAAAGIGPAERRQIACGLARLDALDPRAGDVMLGVLIVSLAAMSGLPSSWHRRARAGTARHPRVRRRLR